MAKECIKMSNEDAVSVSYSDMEKQVDHFFHPREAGMEVFIIKWCFWMKNFLSPRSLMYTQKMLIKRLVKDKVIENCKINRENLEKFIMIMRMLKKQKLIYTIGLSIWFVSHEPMFDLMHYSNKSIYAFLRLLSLIFPPGAQCSFQVICKSVDWSVLSRSLLLRW